MSASTPRRILVLADRLIAAPQLLETVRRKATKGPIDVTLLMPAFPVALDPEGLQTSHTLELAIPPLAEAAGGFVQGIVGHPDPFVAVCLAVHRTPYDEVILSRRSPQVARWAKRDLPRRVRRLGVEVTVVSPQLPAQQPQAH